LDSGKIATGLFLNFKRAFETVNHESLIFELESGLLGVSISWPTNQRAQQRELQGEIGIRDSQV